MKYIHMCADLLACLQTPTLNPKLIFGQETNLSTSFTEHMQLKCKIDEFQTQNILKAMSGH